MAGPLTVLNLAPGPPADLAEELDRTLPSGTAVVLPDGDDLTGALGHADIVIGDWSGRFRLGEAEAEAATGVRLVQQPGVGVNFIDLEAWARRGIPVANTAGANATSVAEWCVASAILLLRDAPWAYRRMLAGDWPQHDLARRGCRDLAEARVGIVGLGAIGSAVAARLAAFGCEIAYWNRTPRPDRAAGARWRPFEELVSGSDVLILTLAETPQTRGLVDAKVLDRMPEGAVLVNAGRGGLVVERDLVAALSSGRLAGAALDVFATEPLPAGSPLRDLETVLLSPHVAGATVSSRRRMFEMTARNAAAVARGEPPRWVVNGVGPA